MSKLRSSWLALVLCAGLLGSAGARAEDDEALGFERTPPRLSFLDGEVSYFRPGADDWTTAVVNTAPAPGDELATGAGVSARKVSPRRNALASWSVKEVSCALIRRPPSSLPPRKKAV